MFMSPSTGIASQLSSRVLLANHAVWIPILSVLMLAAFLVASFHAFTLDQNEPLIVKPLSFSVLPADQANGSLFEVSQALADRQKQFKFRSKLSEKPHWFGFDLTDFYVGPEHQLVFYSRHLVRSQCWFKDREGNLTEVWLRTDQGGMVSTQTPPHGYEFGVCQFSFVGPAMLEMNIQAANVLASSALSNEHRQAFFEGGLYLLIGLSAIAAIAIKSPLLVVYSFWLFASLRVVALSEGWDHTLFGVLLQPEALVHARMVALALYFTSTVLMMSQLFVNVHRASWQFPLRTLQAACIILLLLSLFSPYRIFLELFWPISLMGSCIVAWVAIQYFLENRDRIGFYYLLAMMATLAGAVAEVLAAWFDLSTFQHYFNSASVTIMASVMTGFALAEFLKQARNRQLQWAQEVQRAHDRLTQVFNIAPSAMFTCNSEGELLKFNQQFRNVYLNSENQPLFEFLSPKRLKLAFGSSGKGQGRVRIQVPVLAAGGQTQWFEMVLNRDSQQIVGMVNDFTAAKDKEMALQYQATHDELTGALNRRGFQNCVHALIANKAKRVQVYCLDIKKFSRLISAYGMSVSDQLLQAFYTDLYRHMHMYGAVARLNIDQFVVLAENTNVSDANRQFDAFIQKLKHNGVQLENRTFALAALATELQLESPVSVLDVMDTIEVCMRESKGKFRRNALLEKVVFEPKQSGVLLDESRTIQRLSNKELPAGLTLALQPIVSTCNLDAPIYVEALLRIQDENGRLKPAGYLIDACVHSGQTAFLDNWVLSNSLQFLQHNEAALHRLGSFSINMSPGSLNDDAFLADTLALIQAHPRVAKKLCLEITEVGSVINLEGVQRFIEQVRAYGVRVALDDFGAGYSNFGYAIDLRADVIKIDGSIVRNICTSTESNAVTLAIVGLSQNLGCKCVAEWVEDIHMLRALKALGVDYVQGFLFSPALLAERFLNLNSPLDLIDDPAKVAQIREVIEASEDWLS